MKVLTEAIGHLCKVKIKVKKNKIPPKMTLKQWEATLPGDKEVLKRLGILGLVKPKKRNKIPRSRAPFLKPYVMKRIGTCTVCKITTTYYFRMTLPLTKDSLLSTAITKEDILPSDTLKEGKDFYSGCSHCFKVLSKMTKEELIRKIIKLSR